MSISLDYLISKLPSPLSFLASDHPTLLEMRLCINAPVTLVDRSGRKNTHLICTKTLLEETLRSLTEHSFYSHEDTVKEGYLSLPHGIRVGVCGRAVCKGKDILSIKDISFLSIRIPHTISGVATPLLKALMEEDFQKGALLYSLPGVGKTTVLKDLIHQLAAKGKFVAVIDERGEFSVTERGVACMIYKHYPKKEAIVMAIKTTTPDLLVLDEVGSEECSALLSCALCGVPVVASAHGKDPAEILCRPGFDLLFKHHLFDLLAGITRSGDEIRYQFTAVKAPKEASFAP